MPVSLATIGQTTRQTTCQTTRQKRGRASAGRGLAGEAAACAALVANGWCVLGQRVRTDAGEIDAVAEKDGILAVIEVKARPSLAAAAWALGARQRARLINAAEILLGENPGWGQNGVRFDVMLVDRAGTVRRIADAFRPDFA